MSDGPEGFFFPFPITPDPETLAKMREMQDHQQMVADDYHHGVARFFDSLSEDQLASQKSLLHVIAANSKGGSRVIPAYYEGIVTGMLSAKYHVCIGCDQNHQTIMHEQMQREQDGTQDFGEQTLTAMDGGDPFKPSDTGKVDLKVGEDGFLSDKQLQQMVEYNLDDQRSEENNTLLGFVCTKCGLYYTSIEDRMLKRPDDCAGCHQKQMWG